MREFKIGDKVKVPSKPDSEWKNWDDSMNALLGKFLIVEDIWLDGDVTTCTKNTLSFNATFRPSYLLTELYNQEVHSINFITKEHDIFNQESNMKEIDLTKEQVFTEPLEGYVFDNHYRGSLKAIMKDDTGQIHFFDEECGRWSICEAVRKYD